MASASAQRIRGIPSVSYANGTCHRVVGDSQSHSRRIFRVLKQLGRGQNGAVMLCDWKSPETLPPDTVPPVMQSGKGARAEWRSCRLVAVKKLNRLFEGGWDECEVLRELQVHRELPSHPNIVELYDFFFDPDTQTLSLVLEPTEGNLYHLIKARKGRPFAGGLTSSIFSQLVAGISHMHSLNVFHRDLVPENILVSTTGHFPYHPVVSSGSATKETDVVVMVKLSDFGLACSADRRQIYTQYVGVRWYRAPEMILRGLYSKPVDMWALGAIMGEVLNLAPLFPGTSQIDQIFKILNLMGDPSDAYGNDSHGAPIGGGPWSQGLALSKAWGVRLPQVRPKDLHEYFDGHGKIPTSLVQCIGQLLRYDPEERLTADECMSHFYFSQTTPLNEIPDLRAPHLFSNPNT